MDIKKEKKKRKKRKVIKKRKKLIRKAKINQIFRNAKERKKE